MTNQVFAQSSDNCISTLGPFGDICETAGEGGKGTLEAIAEIFTRVIGVMTIAAGLWFLLQFFIAAFSWLSSGGDPQKISEAQSRITNALVGLILVVAAVAIMTLVGKFFGIPFLNLPKFEEQITPN